MPAIESKSEVRGGAPEPEREGQSRALLEVIAAVRRRLTALVLAEGALWVLLTLACAFAAGLMLDGWLRLPRGARILLLAAYAIAAGAVAWRRLIRPLIRLPGPDELALFIERQRPELRSRLISALQLSRASGGSPEGDAFVRRLVDDARSAVRPVDPKSVAGGEATARAARIVLPVLAALAALAVWTWPTTWILARRAFLEETAVPSKTRIGETSGSLVAGRGDDVRLWARAEGVLPRAGRLMIRHPSGRVQELPLDRGADDRSLYERVVGNAQSSFEYWVRIHDARSEAFQVEVLPRPVVTQLNLTLQLPKYLGLPDREVSAGELSLLRGSTLLISAVAGQPLREAQVRLGGVESSAPATLDAGDERRLTAAVPIEDPGLSSFSLEMTDVRGIPSRDPAVYAIQVVEDRAPRARMILPARREELATPRGTVLVAFEATDDYGLAGLRLMWQRAGGTEPPTAIELDLEEGNVTASRRRFEWQLAGLRPPLSEGDLIEFWLEARDQREDAPGVGRTDRFLIRVVSEAEKRADLLARAGDAIGRLGDVAEGQERLNERLGRIILARPAETTP